MPHLFEFILFSYISCWLVTLFIFLQSLHKVHKTLHQKQDGATRNKPKLFAPLLLRCSLIGQQCRLTSDKQIFLNITNKQNLWNLSSTLPYNSCILMYYKPVSLCYIITNSNVYAGFSMIINCIIHDYWLNFNYK